jgi:hypothetical protein
MEAMSDTISDNLAEQT